MSYVVLDWFQKLVVEHKTIFFIYLIRQTDFSMISFAARIVAFARLVNGLDLRRYCHPMASQN